MALTPISQPTGAGNSILNSILNGQNVSLTGALNAAVQLNRDLMSNQRNQEATFLAERRFDRKFREDQFIDRRNFDRTVLTQDRSFGEGVRQFNVTSDRQDRDLALRSELGRGGLQLNREKFAVDTELRRTAQADSLLTSQLNREAIGFRLDSMREDRDMLGDLTRRYQIVNDPQTFADLHPSDDPLTVERDRRREMDLLNAEFTQLNHQGLSALSGKSEQDIAARLPYEPSFRDKDVESILSGEGDPLRNASAAAEIAAPGTIGAGMAKGIQTGLQAEATAAARNRGRTSSSTPDLPEGVTKQGVTAYEKFKEVETSLFPPGTTYHNVVEEANDSPSREAFVEKYAKSYSPNESAQRDRDLTKLRNIYDSMRGLTAKELIDSAGYSENDSYATYLNDLVD